MSDWLRASGFRGKVRENAPLAPLTWLKAGGPADLLVSPKDADDLASLLRAKPAEVPILPLGVGSNTLARDGGVRGVVARIGPEMAGIEIDGARLIAGAGASDATIAKAAQRASLAGLEFFIGVPGALGGALRMNAGAFGGETADRLAWAEFLDLEGALHRLAASEMGFSYRKTAWPADWIAVRAAFDLAEGDDAAIAARMSEIRAQRGEAQPTGVATGGSTFKNPPSGSAWKAIDAAGCRGRRRGRAQISEKHCNFLVNLGGATAADLEGLGEEVRAAVRAHSGIGLEWEIRRVGEP